MKKGFTLIELLIVTVVVGVLMAVAVPKFYITLERGRTAEGLNYIQQVATDLNAYYMAHGEYPTGADLNPYLTVTGEYFKHYPTLKYFGFINNSWIYRPASNKVWIRLKRPKFYVINGHLQDGTLTGITCYNGSGDHKQTTGGEFKRYCQQMGFKKKTDNVYQMEITPGFRDTFCDDLGSGSCVH